MKFPRNANAPAANRGECDKFEDDKSKPESLANRKELFLRLKTAPRLAHALHADTPLGAALISGSQLVFILRQAGITEARLEFIREGVADVR